MYCPKCGNTITETAAYCLHCGANLNVYAQQTNFVQPHSGRRKKNLTTLLLTLTVIMSVAVVLLGISFIGNQTKDSGSHRSSNNLYNSADEIPSIAPKYPTEEEIQSQVTPSITITQAPTTQAPITQTTTTAASVYTKDYDYAVVYIENTYDVSGWSDDDIQLAINTILARNQYRFQYDDIRNHFSQYPWYNPNTSDMAVAESRFNSIEKTNYYYLAACRENRPASNNSSSGTTDTYIYDTLYVENTYNIATWTRDEIQFAINAILARNHYIFQTNSIQAYFSSFSWYYGNTTDMSIVESRFNSIERTNYEYLTRWRNAKD